MPTYPMDAASFDLVYNSLSFTLASMMASTIFFWLRLGSVGEKYKSAMTITGLVTFIAAYHYIRIVRGQQFERNSRARTLESTSCHISHSDCARLRPFPPSTVQLLD